uniref:Uncharacterized protein n=1 Tax=Manihot esculenta TaxID=3983 RepID=A0A2C9VZ38_MANES
MKWVRVRRFTFPWLPISSSSSFWSWWCLQLLLIYLRNLKVAEKVVQVHQNQEDQGHATEMTIEL